MLFQTENLALEGKNSYRGTKGSGHTQLQTNADIIEAYKKHGYSKGARSIHMMLLYFDKLIITLELPTRIFHLSPPSSSQIHYYVL